MTFDIYRAAVASNCFLRATQTLDVLISFQKNVLPDVWSETHLNIVSTNLIG